MERFIHKLQKKLVKYREQNKDTEVKYRVEIQRLKDKHYAQIRMKDDDIAMAKANKITPESGLDDAIKATGM